MNTPLRRVRVGFVLASAALLAFFTGCSNGTGGTTPINPDVTVSVAGASSVRLGASTQFTATVSNTSNHNVTWEVNGIAAGNAASGTISTTGLYTAPATMPSSATITISAISVVSSSASGSASTNLQNPLPILNSGTATQVGSSLSYAVDVLGSGFVPTSVLQAAGVAQTTTYVSATELQATVAVTSGTTSVSVAVTNPNPGGSTSTNLALPITFYATTATAAARILDQTSFGPTTSTIQHVQQVGLNAYLKEQFVEPTSTLAAIPTNPLPAVCLANNTAYPCAESEWWTAAITGPDQLRQRVAFALSEMFVVSTQSIPGQAIPQFHNALANDAFTNFYTIMKDVALSPAMGGYLNMLDSAAPAPSQIANENFPRENMQLFTLGTAMLNQDGTLQLDSSGNPVQPYTELQVQAFARAFTGWTYAVAGGGAPTKFPNNTADYADPMAAVALGRPRNRT